jgi:hypothetical protein
MYIYPTIGRHLAQAKIKEADSRIMAVAVTRASALERGTTRRRRQHWKRNSDVDDQA